MKQIDFDKVLCTLTIIGLFIVMMIVLSPCLLIFTESKDGSITIWNFVGIAYMLGIVWIIGYVIKQGKKAEIKRCMDKLEQEVEDIQKINEELAEKVVDMRPFLCGNTMCKNRVGVKNNGASEQGRH